MAEQPPPAMTVRDVAGFLAVDEKTIYRLAQQGMLPGFKVGGSWLFSLADIDKWIKQQSAVDQFVDECGSAKGDDHL